MNILNLPVSTVAALNDREDLTLVTDSQDVAAIRDNFGPDWAGVAYDAYFVGIADGDYKEIWGMAGTVPYLSKLVTRLV